MRDDGLPFARPGKIVCVGLNYRDHAEESGMEIPKWPLLFAKWPSSVIGPGSPIVLPHQAKEVDWEAELGVVIGRRAQRVPQAEALDHVAGYVCANEVSARDIQFADGQWTRGKSFDTFCPVGPMVPAEAYDRELFQRVGPGARHWVQAQVPRCRYRRGDSDRVHVQQVPARPAGGAACAVRVG